MRSGAKAKSEVIAGEPDTLYFEGNAGLKRPFQVFLERVIPHLKGRIKPVPGEGRDDAIYDFLLGVDQHPDLSHILLVDGEGPDDGRLFDRLKEEELGDLGELFRTSNRSRGWCK